MFVLFVTVSNCSVFSSSVVSSSSVVPSSSAAGSSTETVVCTVDDTAPSSSFTIRVAVYSPASVYVCTGAAPVPADSSPKFQVYSTISPSESVELEPSKVSSSPAITV